MAERLGVSRANVRDALQKLEFYGILRTLPQSGTVVAGMGISALEGLITDVLQLEASDFSSLVETRVMLELECIKLAAERRTADDLVEIELALAAYQEKIKAGESAVEEDLLFHLSIADASKNGVLKSLMLVITPDIIANHTKYKVCDDKTEMKAFYEHEEMLLHIRNSDVAAAEATMMRHLENVVIFSETIRRKK